jgi:hypothetical protein
VKLKPEHNISFGMQMSTDPSQSLKYGGPMAVEWSYPELQMLNDGLHKYVILSFYVKLLFSSHPDKKPFIMKTLFILLTIKIYLPGN